MDKLTGKKIAEILWNEYVVVFVTDEGEKFPYEVEGDCCSHSYFFDFHGVRNLLDNGPVLAFSEYDLQEGDLGFHECGNDDCGHEDLQVYGYSLTTEHPTWGLMTSVLSFRNESNGYYGGWMKPTQWKWIKHMEFEKLTEDKIG